MSKDELERFVNGPDFPILREYLLERMDLTISKMMKAPSISNSIELTVLSHYHAAELVKNIFNDLSTMRENDKMESLRKSYK